MLRVVTINVGKMPKHIADRYVRNLIQKYKKKVPINMMPMIFTGNINTDYERYIEVPCWYEEIGGIIQNITIEKEIHPIQFNILLKILNDYNNNNKKQALLNLNRYVNPPEYTNRFAIKAICQYIINDKKLNIELLRM